MTRWVSLEDWKRAKGSVSQQLKDKAGPKVRLGRSLVKGGGAKLALAKVRSGNSKRRRQS
jgi:hypothetical protein